MLLLCFGSKATTWWSLNLCGCSWGCSVLNWILLLDWLDGLILALVYCCPIKVWYVASWNTLLLNLPSLPSFSYSSATCSVSVIFFTSVTCTIEMSSVVSNFDIVAMYLHHSVITFIQGIEAFGCVVFDQDEVTCLDWRFISLLVVMFLHVMFSAV